MWSHLEAGFIWDPGISRSRPSLFYWSSGLVFLPPPPTCFLLLWKMGVKTSLCSQRGGRRKSSLWSSRTKTALKSQGRSECHWPRAASAGGHLREGPGRMRSPWARVAARSEQWAGSGVCAAGARFPDSRPHTSRLCFPARPRVSPTRRPTKRFRPSPPRPRP